MRILVLGADGMLGHKMLQIVRQHFPETTGSILGRTSDALHARTDLFQKGGIIETLDVTNGAALGACLRAQKPTVVVNCIGIIKQRTAAHSPIPSITINALLPHQLAALCEEWGGRLIHFSTDCVFSGRRGNYTESDQSDAEDLYGKTKFLGEVATANALTLRTSIIGRELCEFQSLLEWFLKNRNGKVRGFTRTLYSGVTTNHLAQLVGNLIAKHPNLSGLYQVASTTISKHDLLCRLREAYGLKVEITPDEGEVCDRSLRGDKLRAAIGYEAPPWPELVAELARDETPYERWR